MPRNKRVTATAAGDAGQPKLPLPGEARRRTGCWPCKQAHSRCQEQRPACARCLRLGLPCRYGIKLLWQEDAAQRGICLGREGVWSRAGGGGTAKSKKKTGTAGAKGDIGGGAGMTTTATQQFFLDTSAWPPIFLNTTYAHLQDEGLCVDEEEDDRAIAEERAELSTAGFLSTVINHSRRSSSISIPPSLSCYNHLPYNEAYLLDYFTSFICPNCSLSPSHNPYLRYITPMAHSYTPLHHAIVSVAANQLRLLNDNRFEREAWLYKARAMNGLQASINNGAVGWPFVATVLMLCFYDISDGCNESWTTHLRGGLSVLSHVLQQNSKQPGQNHFSQATEAPSLTKFFVMYFVAHQIMGLTAQPADAPLLPSHGWLADDCLEEIDPLMGCSRGLLSLIDRTSGVAARYHNAAASHRDRNGLHVPELESLRKEWEDLAQSIRTMPQTPHHAAVNSDNLLRVAEAKRTTALLYLHDRLAPLLVPCPSSSSSSSSSSSPTTASPPEYSISSFSASFSFTPPTNKPELLAALAAQLAGLPTTPALLWPLFVLGRSSPDGGEEHRRFVLSRLLDMQALRNLGSVRLARRLVEAEFRRWDLGLEKNSSDSGRSAHSTKPLGEGVSAQGKWVSLA